MEFLVFLSAIGLNYTEWSIYNKMKKTLFWEGCFPSFPILTLLHSERPKLYTILAFLSAEGLRLEFLFISGDGSGNDLPAHVISDMAVSRTFQILYRNEDVVINDVILYRFHTLVDSSKVSDLPIKCGEVSDRAQILQK